jgi:hypothetical protein
MKSRILLFSFFLVFSGLLNAQKTINDANAEKRSVGSFHGIDVATGITLVLTEGSTEDVAVSAASIAFREKIVTKVEGGILKIYYENKIQSINSKKERKDLRAYVSYKSLDVLNASTGAAVKIEGVLKSSSLKMEVHTGSEVDGKVDIDDLSVDQGTGSRVTFTGEAGKLSVDGDTGSMFKGIDLKTSNCSVTASTGAGIYITVDKELNVKANTGGFVKYKGDAGIREIKTNSGGHVTKI